MARLSTLFLACVVEVAHSRRLRRAQLRAWSSEDSKRMLRNFSLHADNTSANDDAEDANAAPNEYGTDCKITLRSPVPFIMLINPSSGDKKGKDILGTMAANARSYEGVGVVRNILEFVGKNRVQAYEQFANELDVVVANARRAGQRFRLICGGGDGTPSFCFNVFLTALINDINKKWPFKWNPATFKLNWPTLVQLPLGTGNDLGAVLGVGRKYPKKCQGLQNFVNIAVDRQAKIFSHDAWAITWNDAIAVAELDDVADKNGQHSRMHFKKSPVAPVMFLLYASFGADSEVVARFQVHRQSTAFANKKQYATEILALMQYPPARPVADTSSTGDVLLARGDINNWGIVSKNLDHNWGKNYDLVRNQQDFLDLWRPQKYGATNTMWTPRVGLQEATSMGVMNVNSYAAGIFSTAPPANPGDRFLNAFWKPTTPTSPVLKSGEVANMGLHCLKPEFTNHGVFIQYDGEARLVFNRKQTPEKLSMDFWLLFRIPILKVTRAEVTTNPRGDFEFGPEAKRSLQHIKRWLTGTLNDQPTDGELHELNRYAWNLDGLDKAWSERPLG